MWNWGKWPRLVVAGDPVTEEQADSILIRTMSWWLMFCNDKAWLAQVRAIATEAGLPMEPDRYAYTDHDAHLHETFRVWRPAFEKIAQRCGFLEYLSLDQLANDRILSSHLGWCSWSGVIGTVRSVGKDPGVDEIGEKWQQIAAAFPYLRLSAEVTAESGGREGAVRYEVADGAASWAESAHLPALEPPAAWVAEYEATDLMNERGVDPDRLRRALRSVLA